MPSAKPRVSVLFEESTYKAISQLSEVTGFSKSKIVSDFMKEIEHSMYLMIDAYRTADDIKETAQDAFKNKEGKALKAINEMSEIWESLREELKPEDEEERAREGVGSASTACSLKP